MNQLKGKPPEVRESGFYWVIHHEDRVVTIMRWADFLNTWRDTHGDTHTDDEVTVVSSRQRAPESDEGWPKEFLTNVRWL